MVATTIIRNRRRIAVSSLPFNCIVLPCPRIALRHSFVCNFQFVRKFACGQRATKNCRDTMEFKGMGGGGKNLTVNSPSPYSVSNSSTRVTTTPCSGLYYILTGGLVGVFVLGPVSGGEWEGVEIKSAFVVDFIERKLGLFSRTIKREQKRNDK